MKILKHESVIVDSWEEMEALRSFEAEAIEKRAHHHWKVVRHACIEALKRAGKPTILPPELNAGIAILTDEAHRLPILWRLTGQLAPTDFEITVHNASAGYASINLGLVGAQVAMVNGCVETAARIQLEMGRSKLMIVCTLRVSLKVGSCSCECYVLEVLE